MSSYWADLNKYFPVSVAPLSWSGRRELNPEPLSTSRKPCWSLKRPLDLREYLSFHKHDAYFIRYARSHETTTFPQFWFASSPKTYFGPTPHGDRNRQWCLFLGNCSPKIIVVSNESALGSLCFCVERPQLHRVVAHLDDVTQSVTPDVP